MKSLYATVALILCLSSVAWAEKAPQKIYDLAASKLAAYGLAAEIVAAVKAANATGQSLAQIKSRDEIWKATAGLDDFMKAIQGNPCSSYLRTLTSEQDYYAEIFVMDNQGANVCMTNKTSDYWQGDEAKFQNTFKGEMGEVFIDDVEFDSSAQAYLSQVSVPVVEGGHKIGAITFGIDIDKVQ